MRGTIYSLRPDRTYDCLPVPRATLNAPPIASLSLPDDAVAFIALPPPERSALARARTPGLIKAVSSLKTAWLHTALGALDLPDRADVRCLSCGREHTLSREDLFARLALSIGSYYDYAARKLIRAGGDLPAGFLPMFRAPQLDELLHNGPLFHSDEPDPYEILRVDFRMLSVRYHLGLTAVYFRSLMASAPVHGAHAQLEALAHSELSDLHADTGRRAHPDFRALAHRFTTTLAEGLSNLYEAEAARTNPEHAAGPFSMLQPAELGLLARRDAGAIGRYGPKGVEAAFETQLALVMASLGFFVVRTDRGTRTVDLVCMSADPQAHFSVLLEAKSTARPYAFPPRDQRALEEYARSVQQSLRTMPPLRFILLTSHSAARTLPEKVRAFEASVGVPTRFIPAQELANLREFVIGPLWHSDLARTLARSEHVIESGFARTLAHRAREIEAVHQDAVRTMLPAARSPRADAEREAWPDH